MDVQRIQALLEKYASDRLSAQELEELSKALSNMGEQGKEALVKMYNPLWEKVKAEQSSSPRNEHDWQPMLDAVMRSSAAVPIYKRAWLRYAAVLVLAAGAVAYFLLQQRPKDLAPQQAQVIYKPVDIQPGGNKATLTLSNGQVITLDSAANGSLAVQGNTQIVKLNDGSIAYKDGRGGNAEILYNTIAVPKGGQYQLTLPDGTKVWLNALSVLHYPVSFTGKKRTVQLEGEAYFEVAQNKALPFEVTYKNMQVEVLGTHFNVMAYEDEATIQTTVLEGAVKVQQHILTPGKQARVDRRSHQTEVKEVPAAMFVAWTNGYFHFDKADIPSVLRQIARWYDITIEYKGAVSTDLFSGKIERRLPLQSILRLLQQSNLHFEIKDRTLIVYK